jgi:hypothetical protein
MWSKGCIWIRSKTNNIKVEQGEKWNVLKGYESVIIARWSKEWNRWSKTVMSKIRAPSYQSVLKPPTILPLQNFVQCKHIWSVYCRQVPEDRFILAFEVWTISLDYNIEKVSLIYDGMWLIQNSMDIALWLKNSWDRHTDTLTVHMCMCVGVHISKSMKPTFI